MVIKSSNYTLLAKPGYIFYKFIYVICEVELGIKTFLVYIDRGYNITLVNAALFRKAYLEVPI